MQNSLKLLIELQEIEKKVRTLAEQKARAPVQIAMMKEEESRAGGKVEEKQEMLKSAQGLRKELEREVEDLERRQNKSKQRLLEVKSNKEYQAALKEIDDIEDLIRRREDQIIEQMEVVESLTAEVREHERLLAEARKKLEKEGAQLEKEAAKADTLIASLEEQKRAAQAADPCSNVAKISIVERQPRRDRSGASQPVHLPGMPHEPAPPDLYRSAEK